MKTYQDFKKDEVIESKINVTCIGAFDGLHRGHIELIKKTKEIDNNFQIITFNEIPKIYFDNNLKPLLGNDKRNSIFDEYKPTNLIYLKFDEINELSSDEFLEFAEREDNSVVWSEEDSKLHTIGGLSNDKDKSFMKFINKLDKNG